MKKTRWVNFVWDLAGTKLPAITAPRQFRLSLGKAAERRQLQEVIEKSFALDPGWNAALHMIDAQMKSSIAAAFNSESASWLALQHGTRIVGGTLLMADPDAPAQLVPGPCILMEYRNRGLGTLVALLRVAPFARGRGDPRLRQNPGELAGRALFVSEIRRPILVSRAAACGVARPSWLWSQRASCPLLAQ
jgi:hypothetical protein